MIGRTGRIGNHGLATSFYNVGNADIAPMLVKTLLETNQPVPDFLQEHIPEGWIPGESDVTTLKFEMDSDEEADGNDGGDASVGGWGATDGNATSGGGGWGATDTATNSGGGWGC
jgi:ATP-dependent RNA helicase DDX3X